MLPSVAPNIFRPGLKYGTNSFLRFKLLISLGLFVLFNERPPSLLRRASCKLLTTGYENRRLRGPVCRPISVLITARLGYALDWMGFATRFAYVLMARRVLDRGSRGRKGEKLIGVIESDLGARNAYPVGVWTRSLLILADSGGVRIVRPCRLCDCRHDSTWAKTRADSAVCPGAMRLVGSAVV